MKKGEPANLRKAIYKIKLKMCCVLDKKYRAAASQELLLKPACWILDTGGTISKTRRRQKCALIEEILEVKDGWSGASASAVEESSAQVGPPATKRRTLVLLSH